MKLLIIRFSSIGDIVLTSPIIRCLKAQIPGVKLHYLTKESYASLVSANPHIDRVHTIRKQVNEVMAELRKENFDFVVDLHHNLRSAQVKALLGKRSGSFPKLNLEKWLAVNLKWNRLPDMHIVDRYFKAVEPLGVKNDGKGLEFFIVPQEEISLASLPQPFQKGYTVIVIGARHFTKQLPAVKLASIINSLPRPVVLLGGPEDKPKAEAIMNLLSPDKKRQVLQGCGKYSLAGSASLVRQARNMLSHDTGLMHIGAAFQKEMVSVWGNTIPGFGMYPYYGDKKVRQFVSEVHDLSCRPCSKIGYTKCPKKHFRCMADQDEQAVIQFLQNS